MKTDKNILIAFVLNLAFSVFEIIGGIFTGSVAIISDAVHDIGDAAGIGISYFLEKKSKKQPDGKYTYGYGRYSVLGSAIVVVILIVGSLAVIYNAVERLFNPVAINYDGMILFAVVGVSVNFGAAFFTRGGGSLNQKAVNLHMLEDVLGWAVVLVGAVVMRFTEFGIIDPILSIGVAVFVLINAVGNLKEVIDVFLEKVPCGIDADEIKHHILEIEGIIDVHHIHIWSVDGQNNYATMHIVSNLYGYEIKEKVREELREHGISHITMELEIDGEHCHSEVCEIEKSTPRGHGHKH